MHDWTLVCVVVDWKKGDAIITLKDKNSTEVKLTAKGLADLKIPRRKVWGESVSINETNGPTLLENGNRYLSIEVQSGDVIELEAMTISDFTQKP